MFCYSKGKRIVALVLLLSHSLMSCYNPNMGVPDKKSISTPKKIHRDSNLSAFDLHEELEVPSIIGTAASGREITFTKQAGIWKAQLTNGAIVEKEKETSATSMPVLCEPGYSVEGIAPIAISEQKKLIHIISREAEVKEVGYVYIGKEAFCDRQKDKQVSSKDIIIGELLPKISISQVEDFSVNQQAGNEPNKVPIFAKPSRISAIHKVDKAISQNVSTPSSSVSQQKNLHATQQIAKTNRKENIQLDKPVDKQVILAEPVSSLQATATGVDAIFIAKGDYHISLVREGAVCHAMVEENIAPGFSRESISLPIRNYAGIPIESLATYPAAWHKYHIRVVFPESASDGKGYVQIGNVGGLGGGNSNSRFVTCNECGSQARVVEKVQTDQFLWIKFNNVYYSCAACERKRNDRERRQREEEIRREEVRIREAERRRAEEERREEADRQRRITEREAELRRIKKEMRDKDGSASKQIDDLIRDLSRSRRNNDQIREALEALGQTDKKNKELERRLLQKHQLRKKLAKKIQEAHTIIENLGKEANETTATIEEVVKRREQTEREISEKKSVNQATERRTEAVQLAINRLKTSKGAILAEKEKELRDKEQGGSSYSDSAYRNAGRNFEEEAIRIDREIKVLENELSQQERELRKEKKVVEELTIDLEAQIRLQEESKANLENIHNTLEKVLETKAALTQLDLEIEKVGGEQKGIQEQVDKLLDKLEVFLKLEKELNIRNADNLKLANKLKESHTLNLLHRVKKAEEEVQELAIKRDKLEKEVVHTKEEIGLQEQEVICLTGRIKQLGLEQDDLYKGVIAGNNLEEGKVKALNNKEAIVEDLEKLYKKLAQAKIALDKQQKEALVLEAAIEQQLQNDKACHHKFQRLYDALQEIQIEREKIGNISAKLGKAKKRSRDLLKSAKEINEATQSNQKLADSLLKQQQQNVELYQVIQDKYGGQIIAGYSKELTKVQVFSYQLSKMTTKLKKREGTIDGLADQLRSLLKQQEQINKNILNHPDKNPKGIKAQHKEEIKQINQQLEAIQKQLSVEERKLVEQKLQANQLQDKLQQQLHQEQKRYGILSELEYQLRQNQAIEVDIESVIKEDWVENLQQNITNDKRTEDFIKRLRREQRLLGERGLSKEVGEELAKHVNDQEEKINTDNIRQREKEQAQLADDAEALRNGYAARDAQLKERLRKLMEEEEADRILYEERKRIREENNRQKSLEETAYLEKLRAVAKEARRKEEESRRKMARDQEEAAKERYNQPWYKKVWNKTKKIAGVVWNGLKAGIEVVSKGLKWVGENLWKGIKWVGGVTSEGIKVAAKWLWENKWTILKWIAIIAAAAFVGFLLYSLISASIAIYGVWYTVGNIGGGIACGFIGFHLQEINNLLNGRGWKTNEELRDEERKNSSSSAPEPSFMSHNNITSNSKPKVDKEKEDEDEKRHEAAKKQAEEEKETQKKKELGAKKQLEEDARRREIIRQQEAKERKEAEEKQRQEEAAKKEILQQQEAQRRKEAEQKQKSDEEARKQEEARERSLSKGKEREKLPTIEKELEKEKSLPELSEEEKQFQAGEEAAMLRTKAGWDKVFDFLKKKGPEQRQEQAKKETIQQHANQVEDIIKKYKESGVTSELQAQAKEVLKELEGLIEEESQAYKMLKRLAEGYGNSPDLKEKLEERLGEVEDTLQELEEAHDALQEQEGLLPEEVKDPTQEAADYKVLVKHFNNPAGAAELAENAQQAIQDLLKEVSVKGKEALKEQAQGLRDALGSLISNINRQHKYEEDLYYSLDISDYMPERKGNLSSLENSRKLSQASLDQLCEAFGLDKPDTTSEPPISKETLKQIFNTVLDTTVPGSELIKILLGTAEMPEAQGEWLRLAAETALDFIPGGKAMKALKGGAYKLGIKKLEKQILREGRKMAKIKKATQGVLQKGGHTLQKSTLKKLGLTKEQGREAIHKLKRALNLPPDFHGTIMNNGDLLHPKTGEVIDNIFNYIK